MTPAVAGALRQSGGSVAARDLRRAAALALPVAVPAAMLATFRGSQQLFGDHVGYVAGFGVYWAGCAALSLALLGRERVRRLFAASRPPPPGPAVVGLAVLLWPPVGAVSSRFLPKLAAATPAMVVTALGVAAVN